MSDPTRWRDTEDGEARELVATLAAATPTPEMREAVWSKIAPTLPSGPGSGGGPSGGSPGSAFGSLGAKIVAGAAAVIAAGAIASWLARSPAPVASAPSTATASATAIAMASATAAPPSAMPSHDASVSPVVSASAPPAPASVATARAPARSATVAVAPSSPPAPPLSSADRLREESEGVRRARQLLRDKNAAGALAELDRLARLYPSGPLEEEREVLTIESIASTGRKDEARRRAERFIFERPQSVHAARVRELARP